MNDETNKEQTAPDPDPQTIDDALQVDIARIKAAQAKKAQEEGLTAVEVKPDDIIARLQGMEQRTKAMIALVQEEVRKRGDVLCPECGKPSSVDLDESVMSTMRAQKESKAATVIIPDHCGPCKFKAWDNARTRILRSRGVPSIIAGASFKNFETDSEAQEKAKTKAQEFVGEARGFLILLGDVGLGKSSLAVAVMRETIKRTTRIRFVTQYEIMEDLRRTYRDKNAKDPVQTLKGVDLLVLDEMGLSSGGKDELPAIHSILNHRHGEGLPTIITANGSAAQLREDLGDKMSDRISQSVYHVANFKGKSKRSQKRIF